MTKIAFRAVVSLVFLAALAAPNQRAQAQTLTPTFTPPPHFDHIVIIIQENRTPDTLFGDGPAADPSSGNPVCKGQNGWATNIDLQNGGPNNYTSTTSSHMGCSDLTPLATLQKGGGNHSYKDWLAEYDNGRMDGACNPVSGAPCGQSQAPTNPPYIYVQKGTASSPGVVAPYFQIAKTYGWANYMFQTNEGPSFPAHQFLLSGTSAPTFAGDKFSKYFIADNAKFTNSGCNNSDANLPWIDPARNVTSPGGLTGASSLECYDRNTLVTTQSGGVVSDRIDKAGTAISWRYYAQTRGIIWDAPEADPQTCYGLTGPPAMLQPCSGAEFSHVKFPGTGTGQSAPVLTDIQNCDLQKITWVTPDEVWSDHPGQDPNSLGPSWVADIINAIGQSKVHSNGKCDYWQAEPTAIFVVWDDWGGFYDHVPPPAVYTGTGSLTTGFSCPAPNGWGCGYVYGFRVPLLVVSPFTAAGTVSGPISTWPPKYPPDPCWTHDFGSILAFTEQNFYPAGSQQIAPPGFTYADSNSLDATCNGASVVPLWEFFNGPFRTFAPISAPFPASFFENYYTTVQANGTLPAPAGPDADDDDPPM